MAHCEGAEAAGAHVTGAGRVGGVSTGKAEALSTAAVQHNDQPSHHILHRKEGSSHFVETFIVKLYAMPPVKGGHQRADNWVIWHVHAMISIDQSHFPAPGPGVIWYVHAVICQSKCVAM